MSQIMPNVGADNALFNDFTEMAGAFCAAGWGARYQQISPGGFRGSLLSNVTGPVQITHGHWQRGIQHRGLQPAGTQSLAFTLSPESERVRWLGAPFGPTNVMIQGGRSDFDLLTPADFDLVIFTIDEAFLADRVAALTQRDPESFVTRQGRLTIHPAKASQIREGLGHYFEYLKAWRDSPDRAAIFQAMSGDLTELVLQVIVDGHFEPLPTPALQARVKLVRQAEEFARSRESSVVRMSDVCRQLGVSERALRYVFAELAGMSPAMYLRRQRFNRARQALAQACPDENQVKDIAYEHGFWHLGQFAHDYLKLFGERPSETLASG